MSLYPTKILALFVLPLGWVLLLGLAALLLLVMGRRRAAGWVLVVQLGLFWVCSMPWSAYRLTAWLEGQYPPVALESTPAADAASVLGGAVGAVGYPPGENLLGSSDSLLALSSIFRVAAHFPHPHGMSFRVFFEPVSVPRVLREAAGGDL